MGISGAVMMAAGSGFSAASSYNAGKGQQRIAEYNAQIGELQAEDALARGKIEEQQHRAKVRGAIGSQRAAFAAAGVDPDSGSGADVQADTAKFGEMDALTIRLNAQREAWGYKVGAEDSRARGKLARQEGTARAVSTIATGAGNIYSIRQGIPLPKNGG